MISIVIPTTSKELKLAEECKKSILNSTYKDVEVLIINEGKERSEQRNIGIDRARGEYIMYLDSDQSVSPKLLEECVELMKNGFGALYIPEKIITKGWFARLRDYERGFYDGTAVDCVRFFRAKNCPKFDVTLKGPEDSNHDRRVTGIRTITKNCIYHNDGIGFFDYFKKKAYYAKSMKKYRELNPNDKVLDWKYRCFWIFVEDGKWKRILLKPIFFAGVVAIIIIRSIIYLNASINMRR